MKSFDEKLLGITKFIRLAQTDAQLSKLLTEILTPSEVEKIHERIKILTCLSEGLSYRETAQVSGAAIATVTRGAGLMKNAKLLSEKLIVSAQNKTWWQKLF